MTNYRTTTAAPAKPASDKQIQFMARLRTDLDSVASFANEEQAAQVATATSIHDMATDGRVSLNTKAASGWIDATIELIRALRRQQREAAPAPASADLEQGIYLLNGTVYKVQIAVHGSGRPYAKRLAVEVDEDGKAIDTEWVYAPGIVRQLTTDHLMDFDKAKAYGAISGVCAVCGAILNNELSIELGIGPVCRKRFGR